jgi:hypothetical protein
MPFTSTPKRNKEQLTAFFRDHLKTAIERARFSCKYVVTRSDDTFNITEKIITDVYNADIMICDLSGKESNPNVMYELGMRLALTHKPVILIREANEDNCTIFDIGGFFAHPYDPLNYAPLLDHIKSKIRKLETGEETYRSPVLTLLEQDNPLLVKLSTRRAREKLRFLKHGVQQMLRLFSGHLAAYLKEKGVELDLGKTTDKVIPNINKERETFDKIDLSAFHCSLSSQPMIDAYLAEQFLNNIAPAEVVAPFTLQLISFHAHYFGMDLLHYRWTPLYTYMFFGETQILLSMIDAALAAVGHTTDECSEIIKAIEELKKQSRFA